jgi:hypothetical protein
MIAHLLMTTTYFAPSPTRLNVEPVIQRAVRHEERYQFADFLWRSILLVVRSRLPPLSRLCPNNSLDVLLQQIEGYG